MCCQHWVKTIHNWVVDLGDLMVGIWVFDLTKNFDDHPWAGERLGFEGDEQEKKPFDMILGLQNELP